MALSRNRLVWSLLRQLLIVAVAIVGYKVWAGSHPRGASAPAPAVASAPAASGTATPAASGATSGYGAAIGFRSEARLREHFEKHGSDFHAVSASDYLALAQALRDRPVGGDVLELRRPDGSVSRFDRASGSFLAFDADGTIRTFFKPNDGERYFERQAGRRH